MSSVWLVWRSKPLLDKPTVDHEQKLIDVYADKDEAERARLKLKDAASLVQAYEYNFWTEQRALKGVR